MQGGAGAPGIGSESEGRTDTPKTEILAKGAEEQTLSYQRGCPTSNGGGAQTQREGGGLSPGVKAGSPGPTPSGSPGSFCGRLPSSGQLALVPESPRLSDGGNPTGEVPT